MKLMIVDDSLIIRNKINRSLLTQFSKIIRANNGKQALDAVLLERPNIITMDLTMPEMGGVEAIQKILEIVPNTRILVISALADKATAIQALTLGANGFLCKPFNKEDLETAIQRILNLELTS